MTCGQTWKFLTGARSKYSSLSIFVIPTLQYNSIAVRLLRNHICKKQKTLHWRESNIASSFALLISSRFVRQVWDIWEIRIDNPMFVKRALAESYFDWCLNHWTPRLNTWCRKPSWRVMQGIAQRVQLAKWRSSPDAVMSCWWSCPLHSTLGEGATLCVTDHNLTLQPPLTEASRGNQGREPLCSWGTKQKFVWCPKCWKPPQIDRERLNIPQQDGSQRWWDKVGILEMIFEKRQQVLQQTDNIYQRGWEEFLLKQQCLGGTTRFLALPPSTIPWAVASFPFQFPGLVVP